MIGYDPRLQNSKLDFLDEKDEIIQTFVDKARPSPRVIDKGVYVSTGKAPFLEVCGKQFHHLGISLVPIVHVKLWPLKARAIRYTEPMESAKLEVRKALNIT